LSFDQTKFFKALPPIFVDILETLKKSGFIATVVGGVPREYFLTGTIGKDWDLELTHPTLSYSKDIWKNLNADLAKWGKTTILTYDVIRLVCGEYQFEFSPPRIETFSENWQQEGHRNFTVDFDFSFPYEKAVQRRDFTINSIGIRFQQQTLEVLDPLEGIRHLREKILHPAGMDFHKDPVRFFRALRFKYQFNFQFSDVLQTILETMPVHTVSAAYLWMEMQKSPDPFKYYLELLSWRKFHPTLTLPVGEELLKKAELVAEVLVDPRLQEVWIIALEWAQVDSAGWVEYFSFAKDHAKRLVRWAQSSCSFIGIYPEKFQHDFEEVIKLPEFNILFDWYFTTKHLLQKNTSLPLLQMIEKYLPHWIHLYRFEALKDVKHIDPPLRAKYQVWNLCQRL
jgi:tRNA nucleotidyltransferase/poly(A) polymerase